MLRAYANDNLLGRDWLLGQEGEQTMSEGESSAAVAFSLSDVGKYASKAGELVKTGQSALNTVTGGGRRPQAPSPGWRPVLPLRQYEGRALEVAVHVRGRPPTGAAAKATAKKKTSTSTYLLIAAGVAVAAARLGGSSSDHVAARIGNLETSPPRERR